ncbi:MAG: hypothetical protein ACM3ME_04935 [Chloroflexota bacterium]|nr:hypothetical protein [Lentimicrobium sp.]
MKLKTSFIAILITVSMFSCSYPDDQKSQKFKEDSVLKADSVAAQIKQQKIIDSINAVTREQQIIADSIQRQITE